MSKLKRTLWAAGIGGTIALILIGIFFGARWFMEGRIPAGASISGINISFLTVEEAIEKVTEEANRATIKNIKFNLEGRQKDISIDRIGLKIFPKESVQMIEEVKKADTSLVKFFIPLENRKIDILVSLDKEKLFAELDKKFLVSNIAPQPANFYFDENGTLEISEAKKGFLLDKESLVSNLKKQVKSLKPGKINLDVSLKESTLVKADLEEKKDEIIATLAHTFKLKDPVYSDPWGISLSEHPDWISFIPNEEKKSVSIEIKQDELNRFIDAEISQWLDDPVAPVNIYKDEEGNVQIEGRGHNGTLVQREVLKDSIEVAVANKFNAITIPIKEIVPELKISKELQELGIKERIGVGHTSFYGSSANRVHNIKNGASKFNGKIIKPGEIFSFNTNLGAVDGSTGYRRELVIKEEGTIPEYGGGLCQVSTTMYRAILFSGLPVVERNPHSYAVSYYSQILGHGLDATIYLGGSDLKFKNDTEGHILVQAYTKDNYELYFVFYGTDPQRKVELEGPFLSNYHSPGGTKYIESTKVPPGTKKQVEISHVGFTADWYRYITDADGNTTKEYLPTKYRAIPAKVLVGVNPSQ